MRFFVGLHQPSDAQHFDAAFISINRLRTRKGPFEVRDWIMDSGAFTTLDKFGTYPTSPAEYAAEIRRWRYTGNLLAAVSQDWMCEPHMLARTGLTVVDHQRLTIERYDALLAEDTGVYILPVLQGYEPAEYVAHIEQYGSRLKQGAWVGVGSVCKRNVDPQAIIAVLEAVKERRPDLRLHGFGVKTTALRHVRVRELLHTADSMAWSFAARKQGRNANDWQEAKQFELKIKGPSVQDWLTRFVAWTHPYGEAPEHVYWWIGLATVSSVLRRRVWLDRGTYVLYPNLNVMFIADPAVIAKSTSLKRGSKLLRDIEGVHLGPDTATWQAFFDEFTRAQQTFVYQGKDVIESPLACFVSELGTLIDAMDKQALMQFIDFWDGEDKRKRTLTGASFDLINPLISIVGCTTPDWFESSFDQRAVKGGFMSRFLLVRAFGKDKLLEDPNEAIAKTGRDLWNKAGASLQADLRAMASYVGPYKLDADAAAWMRAWYTQHNEVDLPAMPEVMKHGYGGRKHTMIYKTAMCLSAARNLWPRITVGLVQEAAGLVTALEPAMAEMMRKIGLAQHAAHAEKVLVLLNRRSATKEELMAAGAFSFVQDAWLLEKLLIAMAQAGMVKRGGDGRWSRIQPAAAVA